MEWMIVMMDKNQNICKKQIFIGTYNDARVYANKLLYSSEKYWGYKVEIA
jgi:hypothetical protein